MEIEIIDSRISRDDLMPYAKDTFGDMVKAVVDLEQEIMAIGGELHADEETLLNEKMNSRRENVWGINLYPEKTGEDWIEFNSMINIKPHLGNRSRDVEDDNVKKRIREVIARLVQ